MPKQTNNDEKIHWKYGVTEHSVPNVQAEETVYTSNHMPITTKLLNKTS